MRGKFHGVFSLTLLVVAFIIAFIAIFMQSATTAVIYLLFLVSSALIITYLFCAKCPCRLNSCGHILPGLLTRVLPKREEGKYTLPELAAVAIAMGTPVLIAQRWLWEERNLFIAFWALVIVGGLEAILFVCKACDNKYCPVNTKK